MTDLSSVLSSQLATSLQAKAQADAASAQKSATAAAKRLDAAIRGTGAHTLMFASAGAGAVIGIGLDLLVRHFL
jgi:hypothetical protein